MSFKFDCYRYGEEFVVVMEEVSIEEAVEMADAFREKFASVEFNHEGIIFYKTISIGLAALHEGDDTRALLSKADQAMHDAKNSGKNKVNYQ